MVPRDLPVDVLAVVPYFVPRIGGGETHLKQLSQELSRIGHRVTVLTLRIPGTASLDRRDHIEVRRFGDSSTGDVREQGYRQILEYVGDHDFPNSVLYEYLCVGSEHRTVLMSAVLTTAREKRIPRVIRIPSSGRVTELDQQYQSAIDELVAANAVIALNPGIRRELLHVGVSERRIVDIPNGVYVEKFVPRSDTGAAELRQRFRVAPGTLVFVSPSRLARKKRIPDLLQIWKDLNLRDRVIAASELWIVGDDLLEAEQGKISRELNALACALGLHNVRFLGGVPHDDMPMVYQSADVFVMLSLQEGMSNAMLEAMAAGLPIVAPDTEAVTHLVQHGWNGFLFSAVDAAACEGAIRDCAHRSKVERLTMGARSRDRICSQHRMECVAVSFSDLFNRVWAEQRGLE
jgi:glycosyltransferase involved in cell wall biosynthesis